MFVLVDLTTINKKQRWLKIYGKDFTISLPDKPSKTSVDDSEEQ